MERIAQGCKKSTADSKTRPQCLTILYAPLTNRGITALLHAVCPKVCLGLDNTPLEPPLSTGNMTSALSTEVQLLLHPSQLCHLCWHEKQEALEVQANSPCHLNCPIQSGLLLRREQELTDPVPLSLRGLLVVKIFLFHLFLHEQIWRTACSVLDFFLYLMSLRPKVRQRPSAADQYSLGTFL